MNSKYRFVPAGYVDGIPYVSVLDSAGNVVEYTIPLKEAHEKYDS